MTTCDPSEDELIDHAATGDVSAVRDLLDRHRERLLHMVAVRMDPRVAQRVDPSDVVQDSLLEAYEKLTEYARTRPLPLYPWLRQIVWQHLMRAHERHIYAKQRSVARETSGRVMLSDDSVQALVEHLVDSQTSPSGRLMRQESAQRVRSALSNLSPRDGDVLVMRYLEHLSISEIASTLQISENAVRMRQLRALQKLRKSLPEDDSVNRP